MSQAQATLNTFKGQVIQFLDELIQQFPQEADLVLARIYVKDRVSAQSLITTFIQEALPYEEQINNYDEQFFLENAGKMFGSDNSANVVHFSNLWKSNALDKSDRDAFFEWFKAFIFLAKKWQTIMKDLP